VEAKEICLIDAGINGKEIFFKFSGLEKLFNVTEIVIKYDDNVDFLSSDVLANMFLSFTLPVLARIVSNNIILKTKLKLHNDTKLFWEKYINKVQKYNKHLGVFNLKLDADIITNHEILYDSQKPSKIAVLYGGGVESNYTLASFISLKPILIVFEGKNYMNNRTGQNQIKQQLLDGVCKENNIEYERVYVPFREENVSIMTEVDFNNFLMGPLFYFLSLPIVKRHNISIIFSGQEQEDLSPFRSTTIWDYSFSSHLINQLYIGSGPMMKGFGGYASKCSLIYDLYHLFPKFYKYIYSCYCCGKDRWEGKCLKCNRIAYYCDKLKLDKKPLGLPDTVTNELISPEVLLAEKKKYLKNCDEFARYLGFDK